MATFSSEAEARRVFEEYFNIALVKNVMKERYFLAIGPFSPTKDKERAKTREEEEDLEGMFGKGGGTPTDSSNSNASDGSETPVLNDKKQQDDVKAVKENLRKYLYLPEYNKVYLYRNAKNRPTPRVFEVNVSYRRRPESQNYFSIRDPEKILEGFEQAIFALEKEITNEIVGQREVFKAWVGDGRFTGYKDVLYYFEIERLNGKVYYYLGSQNIKEQIELKIRQDIERNDGTGYGKRLEHMWKDVVTLMEFRGNRNERLKVKELYEGYKVTNLDRKQGTYATAQHLYNIIGQTQTLIRDQKKRQKRSRGQGPNKRQRRRFQAAEFQALLKF
jgi:hypothetical protein